MRLDFAHWVTKNELTGTKDAIVAGKGPTNKKSNIRQLAAETGYSVATISRVMNGAQNVSDATREAVLEAARLHDYRPNPAARALVTKRSRIVGAIVPTLAHSIFSTFLDEIELVFAERSYSLVVAMSYYDPEIEVKRAQDMLGMGAEALIVSGVDHLAEFHQLIDNSSLPCIHTSIWKADSDSTDPMIGYDNYGLAREAIEYLITEGHRRIAVLHGPATKNDRTRARLAGTADGARDGALVQTFECTLSTEGGVHQTRAAIESGFAPTAILCLNDVVALGSLFELPRLGLHIPEDISLMGFDNLEWSAYTNPALTTVALPTKEMGHVVAGALADHLDQDMPLPHLCLPGHIIKRESVAPPKDKST